jgi:hypothetical protein
MREPGRERGYQVGPRTFKDKAWQYMRQEKLAFPFELPKSKKVEPYQW